MCRHLRRMLCVALGDDAEVDLLVVRMSSELLLTNRTGAEPLSRALHIVTVSV